MIVSPRIMQIRAFPPLKTPTNKRYAEQWTNSGLTSATQLVHGLTLFWYAEWWTKFSPGLVRVLSAKS